jgi:hypothetical protein
MMAIELNYNIYDKVILVIVSTFQISSKYLEYAKNPILLFSDYKDFGYCIITKVLNWY